MLDVVALYDNPERIIRYMLETIGIDGLSVGENSWMVYVFITVFVIGVIAAWFPVRQIVNRKLSIASG